MSSKYVKTICPYCGVGCGVLASIDEQGVVSVKGDPDHPANFGRLCSKGSALGETVYLQNRLLYPEINGEQVSWQQALGTVATGFQSVIKEYGPDSVALYVSGQLMTEDYYVANKLMKGFIGSANIDTNSRLCMSSVVAAQKRAFGEDVVPGCYEDLERAKMIVITGSNTAWCHPVLFQRISQAKKDNPDLNIILIDPRETQTIDICDFHLPIKPGTDSILFNGLLSWLQETGEKNELFVNNFTEGMDKALTHAKQSAASVDIVAEQCDLNPALVKEFYRLYARTERVVTVFSQGINQSSSGVDKINAIINCHLFTGRIGRPGMGPFSLTGQPNAMGGREVGGLANQLAAHMEISNSKHRDCVQRFWQSPVIADKEGLKAVDLFDAIDAGKVKAIWIMATNPVVSLPNADKVKTALQKCDLVVVSDCVRETDTTKLANVLLPALTWGERDGTVTNSERRISRQIPLLPRPGDAQADWWIISQVAKYMGFAEAFSYKGPVDIFSEHAALSAFENDGERAFNIGALAGLSLRAYNELQPIQWPISTEMPQGSARVYSEGKFSTDNGRAKFFGISPRLPANIPTTEFPFILNTGRIRDQWHTMTRTGMSPRLSTHIFEPYVEIHPDDAQSKGLADASLAEVCSPLGKVAVRVKYSSKQQQGSIFIPMHWNEQFCNNGRVGSLIQAVTDPISGQPESKHSVANIVPLKSTWQGFILTRRGHLECKYTKYWVRTRAKGLWRYEIAGTASPDDWAEHAHQLLSDEHDAEANWTELFDKSQQHYRAARFVGEKLESCIFIAANIQLPPRNWLIGLFQKEKLEAKERAVLLSGLAPSDQEDTGRIVCACFNVGEKSIAQKIKALNLTSAEQIGQHLNAGTNCGSCLPELRELIRANA